jgi:hypothetical protein
VIPSNNLLLSWRRAERKEKTTKKGRTRMSKKNKINRKREVSPLIFLNIPHMFSKKLWSKYQMEGSLSSSSKGTAQAKRKKDFFE